MPTYPLKNLKTGETKTLNMTMQKYDQWRKDNPSQDRDWETMLVFSSTPELQQW